VRPTKTAFAVLYIATTTAFLVVYIATKTAFAVSGTMMQSVEPVDLRLVGERLNVSPGKATRQRALVAALHGRPRQPRDEQGKLPPSTSFDGGARGAPAPSTQRVHHRPLH
jgi:hypothetical protein